MLKIKVQKFAAELYAIVVKSAKYVNNIAADYLTMLYWSGYRLRIQKIRRLKNGGNGRKFYGLIIITITFLFILRVYSFTLYHDAVRMEITKINKQIYREKLEL